MSSTCEASPTRPMPVPSPKQGRHDRESHREERAEADEQHDDRGQHADRRRGARLRELRSARSPARRARPRAAASRLACATVDHLLDRARRAARSPSRRRAPSRTRSSRRARCDCPSSRRTGSMTLVTCGSFATCASIAFTRGGAWSRPSPSPSSCERRSGRGRPPAPETRPAAGRPPAGHPCGRA